MIISTLGPEGSYSGKASRIFAERLKLPYKLEFYPTVYDALCTVRDHRSNLAVIPWYNSVDGLIGSHIDDLLELGCLQIYDEVVIPIKHYLASSKKISLEKIEKVYSHHSALQQCRKKLRTKLPGATLIPVSSTSEAAQLVKKEDKSAAICSIDALKQLELEILDEDIQDYLNIETRFFVCNANDHERTGNDRTIIVVRYGIDIPGLLYETVKEISERNINLYLVQSRPYKITPEEFIIILGLTGHRTDKNVRDALDSIKEQTLRINGWLRVLGSYPRRECEKSDIEK